MATEPEVEPLPDAALAIVPFGVSQFVWKEPGRGALYAATQAVGVGLGIYAVTEYHALDDAGDVAGADTWQNVAGVAVGAAVLSYGVSVIDGSRLAEARARAAAEAQAHRGRVGEFDRGRALARAPTP